MRTQDPFSSSLPWISWNLSDLRTKLLADVLIHLNNRLSVLPWATAVTATRPQPLGAIRGISGIIWSPVYLSLCPTGHHVWVHNMLVCLLKHFFLFWTLPRKFPVSIRIDVSLETVGSWTKHMHQKSQTALSTLQSSSFLFLFFPLVPSFFPLISPLHSPLAPNPLTSSVDSKGGFQTPCDPGPLLGAGSLLSPLQLWTKQLSWCKQMNRIKSAGHSKPPKSPLCLTKLAEH